MRSPHALYNWKAAVPCIPIPSAHFPPRLSVIQIPSSDDGDDGDDGDDDDDGGDGGDDGDDDLSLLRAF